MIDWIRLAFHVCWIFGASLLLAGYSYRRWERQMRIQPSQKTQTHRLIQEITAYFMVGIGMVATNDIWWQKLLWGMIIALQIGQKLWENRLRTKSTSPNSNYANLDVSVSENSQHDIADLDESIE